MAPASALSRRARPHSLIGQPHASDVSTNGLWQNLTPPAGCCSCKVGYLDICLSRQRGGRLAGIMLADKSQLNLEVYGPTDPRAPLVGAY